MVQQALSFDWEALLPILFFLLYGLSQFFGGRGEQEDEGGSPEKGGGKGSEAMREAEERARKIREEIRRKMAERREQAQGRGGATARPASEPEYDPTVPETAGRRQRWAEEAMEESSGTSGGARESGAGESGRSIGGESGIERRLAEQRRRLEESRRKQEEARAQARQIERKAQVQQGAIGSGNEVGSAVRPWGEELPTPSGLRSALLAGIRDPKEIRKAILYREVLEPPVSMREPMS